MVAVVPKKAPIQKSSSSLDDAHWLVQAWLKIYYTVPKIPIGSGGFGIGFMLLCMSCFYVVRIVMEHYVLEASFGWPHDDTRTKDAAASLTGIFHSTNLVPVLFLLLRHSDPSYNPFHHMTVHPKWWQDCAVAMIQMCTGYMIYDGIVNILLLRWVPGQGPVFGSDDWLYLGHHIATTFYMLSALSYQAGHVSAMMCMFLGEFTNPAFNSYLICQMAKNLECCSGPFAQQVIAIIDVVTAVLFLIFRAVLGPAVMLHMTPNLFMDPSARQHIPLVVRVLWLLMIWIVVIGSIPWVFSFTELLKQHFGFSTSESTSASPEL